MLPDGNGGLVKAEEDLPFDRSDAQLYPVSIPWQPPFNMLLHLMGQGDLQVPFILIILLIKRWSLSSSFLIKLKGQRHVW